MAMFLGAVDRFERFASGLASVSAVEGERHSAKATGAQ